MDFAAIQVELERLLDVCVDLPALETPTLALWRCGAVGATAKRSLP
jgi:hypothetical protein